MSDDPRWNSAASYVLELNAEDGPSDERKLELWQAYVATLEAIAGDLSACPDDRTTAQDILDQLDQHMRQHTGEALACLAEIAGDKHNDPELRRNAQQVLRRYAKQLSDAGLDISRWVTTPPGSRQN